MTAEHPHASRYRDRHGHERWRFRRRGRTIALPGAPGDPAFETAYLAAIAGREPPRGPAVAHPARVEPRSLKAAWRVVSSSAEWRAMRESSRVQQRAVAERFLTSRVDPDGPLLWGDAPLADLKRRHVKTILAGMADTPHAGAMVLRCLRKLIGVGLDEEWIDTDPTHRLRHRPAYAGWRAWTDDERRCYEARWPLGTTPRLAYALALYTGLRRADVAALRWSDVAGDEIAVTPEKTGRALRLPVLPALAQALAVAPRDAAEILLTQYGRPFSVKALGMRMQSWTRAAGLPPGCTMHGLRKTLGKLLAEGGATTRQLMDVLGHTNIAHAELYSREAEQRAMARAGMKAVGDSLRPRPAAVKGDGDP